MEIANSPIIVTICCMTFNHENYIRDCLEGFIMQRTQFPFEVLIHDDCSTDGTTEIIKEYEIKYPEIIKVIYQTENQYTKIGFSGIFELMHMQAQGKYIALCEGDDYWIDPYKLNKQIEFLEDNPACGLIYTQAIVLHEDVGKDMKGWAKSATFEEILLGVNPVITPTSCYRKSLYKQYVKEIQPDKKWKMADYPLWLYISFHNQVYFMDERTAVYRHLAESASHSSDIKKNIDFILSTYIIRKHIDEKILDSNFQQSIRIKYVNDLFDCSRLNEVNLNDIIWKFAKEHSLLSFRLLIKLCLYQLLHIFFWKKL